MTCLALSSIRSLHADSTCESLAVGIQIQNWGLIRRLQLSSRPMTSWTSWQLLSTRQPAPPTHFAVPLFDDAFKEARKAAVPKTMQKDTLYCIRLWNESRTEEQILFGIIALSLAVLQRWLSCFVLELRKKDSSTAYPPDSLYHVMWHHEIYLPEQKA